MANVGSAADRAAVETNGRSPASRAMPGVLVFAWLGLVTLGFNTTRVGGFAISDLLFLLTGGVIVARLITDQTGDIAGPEMRRSSPLVFVGSILLLTGGTLSAFQAWDGAGSIQVVMRLAWLTFAWFWILRAVCRDRYALARVLLGWRLGVLIAAGIGVISDLGLVHVGAQNVEGRQTGFFGQPNEFGAMLAFALPLFVLDVPGRGDRFDDRRSWPVRFAMLAVVAWGLAASGSMTATVSAGAGCATAFVVVALTRRRDSGGSALRRSPLKPFLVVAAFVVGLFVLSTSDLPVMERFDRYQSGDSYVVGSVATREDLNRMAIERLPDTILAGTGLQLEAASGDVRATTRGANPRAVQGIHNMYLKVAHEAGVPALVGLLIVILTAYQQAWRLAVNTRGTPLHGIAAALFGAIAGASCQAMFHPILFQRYFWVTIAMTTCLWAVRRNELRDGYAGQASSRSPETQGAGGSPAAARSAGTRPSR